MDLEYEVQNARTWEDERKPQHDMAPHGRSARSQQKQPRAPAPEADARAVAGRWQLVPGHKAKKNQRHNRFEKFNSASNGDAAASWRCRRPPTDKVAVVINTADKVRDRLAELAEEQGAYLNVVSVDGDLAHLGLWGERTRVRAAKAAINIALGDDRGQGAGKTSFAKLASLTPALRELHEKRWRQSVKCNRFGQVPPSDTAFGAIGSFHWPSHEFRPEEVLGSNFEALDPIRLARECYIIFVPETSCFQIMGDVKDVQDALLSIRHAFFQLVARSINGVRKYFSHWRSGLVPSHIYLAAYGGPRSYAAADSNMEAEPTDVTPRGEGDIEDQAQLTDALDNSALSIERCRLLLANALKKMHFYQGHLTLGCRLGTFVLQQYRQPADDMYELKEYEDMVEESQFIGRVTEELGDVARVTDVLSAIQGASDILTPQDAMLDSLDEVRPSYSAIFTFASEDGDLRLVKSWTEKIDWETDQSQMVAEPDQWYRLDRDNGAPTPLLDIALTDVRTGSAWQFDLVGTRTIVAKKLHNNYTQFANKVQIDLNLALKQSTEECFVKFHQYLPFRSLRQEVRYRFNIKQTDYTLELVRFQDRKYHGSWSLDSKHKVTEPCWALHVFRAEWVDFFTHNEKLKIGKSAEWTSDMDSWFPAHPLSTGPNPDGFMQLIEKLELIEKVLRGNESGLTEKEEDTSLEV